jgi:hypothetical protein
VREFPISPKRKPSVKSVPPPQPVSPPSSEST